MIVPERLLSGYHRFRAGRYSEQAELYKTLSQGQQPTTMVIGCADSRVDPATIFAAGPGELFVVRNVAALVPPDEQSGSYHGTSAAIEFAVSGLGVQNIVILGHGLCGGVRAALAVPESGSPGVYIGPWVELLAEPRDDLLRNCEGMSPADLQKELERRAVRQSILNLLSFPFVAQAVAERRLNIHGAWFSIAEGELQWLDTDAGRFETVPERT